MRGRKTYKTVFIEKQDMVTIAFGFRDRDTESVKGVGGGRGGVHSNCCLQPLSQLVLPVEVDFLHNLRMKTGATAKVNETVYNSTKTSLVTSETSLHTGLIIT